MAEVDPYDDSIIRFAKTRHKYDPETKHFRWTYESAYDNEREFKKKFEQISNDLEARQLSGQAHSKEDVSCQRLEVGYFQNSQARREARHAQGAYRELDWKFRFVLALEKVRRFIFSDFVDGDERSSVFRIAYSKAFIAGKWQYARHTQTKRIIPLNCGT
jgi:hypothetical protein